MRFTLIKLWKKPQPIPFIRVFKHYLLLEMEWAVEFYSVTEKTDCDIGWLFSQSVHDPQAFSYSLFQSLPILEGHAGDPIYAGLVLELQTWRCDASMYLFSPASRLLIKHCLPWAWSDVQPLLPLTFSPMSSLNYAGMFMQFGVLIFKTSFGNKLPQNCPCIVLCC